MDKDTYRAMRQEMGKDALKAMGFFFLGLPIAFGLLVSFFMF